MREAVLQVTLLWGVQHLLSPVPLDRNAPLMFTWINAALWHFHMSSRKDFFSALSCSLQIGILIRHIYICLTGLPDHVCFVASDRGQPTYELLFRESFQRRSQACCIISAVKLSDLILLKGKSNTNVSRCSVISLNDLSLIVSLHHLPGQNVDKAPNTVEMIALERRSEWCIPNARHDLYMRITSQGRLLLRNGLSMSEVITLINF